MTQDFPTCIRCDALPDSRDQELCQFCSAPLPWSEYDLRSRRVVVIVPERTMDDAIQSVGKSMEFHLASVAVNRKRRRNRKRRPRRSAKRRRTSKEDLLSIGYVALTAFLVVLWGLAVSQEFGSQSITPYIVAGTAVAALAIWGAVRQFRAGGKVWRVPRLARRKVEPAGIVELGAPRRSSKLTETMVRDVTLRLRGKKQRKFVADTYLDLHAGDIGIAKTVGGRITMFDRLEHWAADTQHAAAKD